MNVNLEHIVMCGQPPKEGHDGNKARKVHEEGPNSCGPVDCAIRILDVSGYE